MVTTDFFVCNAGEIVNVSIEVVPEDVIIKVGLIDSNGEKKYITGQDWIEYNFIISTAGNYKVFVENNNRVTVSVDGDYGIH